ncbi:hypothetical protein EON64_19230 [archaeon]|nr:MAG: hypothetical protein EON64_19230 [archaeon]
MKSVSPILPRPFRPVPPPNTSTSLHLHQVLIQGGEMQRVNIKEAKHIHTEALQVGGRADMRGEVMVGGSITVRGSVIGSGPYVDSSDARWKRKVKGYGHALDKVRKMQAVSNIHAHTHTHTHAYISYLFSPP